MVKDKWEKYRNMTDEELWKVIDSGDSEAAAYQYIERDDDEESPLGGSIARSLHGDDFMDELKEDDD